MSKPKWSARQGDVYMETTDHPISGKQEKPKAGLLTLAHGEVTGHHHSISANRATMFRDDALAYSAILEIEKPTTLTHQEHTAITIPVGRIGVRIQSDYSPEEIRSVAD